MYNCDVCNIEFKRGCELASHKRWNHIPKNEVMCEKCGKILKDKVGLFSHSQFCTGPKIKKTINPCSDERICEYGCGQKANFILKNERACCSKSYNSCSAIRKNNRDKHINKPSGFLGKIPWNKSQTKYTDDRIKKQSESLKTGFLNNLYKKEKYNHSQESIERIKESIKNRYILGTIPPNGPICKTVKYISPFAGETYVQGSWEYAFAKYLDDNNINWERNKRAFPYIYENKSHNYYPDFYILDWKCFVEIKGYIKERDISKWEQFTEKLFIFSKYELVHLGLLSNSGKIKKEYVI